MKYKLIHWNTHSGSDRYTVAQRKWWNPLWYIAKGTWLAYRDKEEAMEVMEELRNKQHED